MPTEWVRNINNPLGCSEPPKMGAPALDSGTCMNGIELGTEIFWGEGEFNLHEFDVKRNGS